ncbi:MAG: DUF4258 domain-containing protein [Deltaproteobacteria bacterium]|nr:DUF4258 domain-containing protein [Deltaproteobacteria bacterium]MBI2181164.1 DUF4258 domain-containing protein [Deltaproteobacteria bacterium]MBI2228083.1 DUF4258 domain-containing protein [Deltaproteobacteria bacterium]MBI2368597.1 DUF4258 domain-containing protein [Deltaproteobacteria bacterium]MBI2530775.1 DUF4258 domain-containing protein [Deltaproteobacteria bacterium]
MRRIIDRIREKVRSGEYALTHHAIDEMADDSFEEEDFEEAIVSGRIVRRQKDRLGRRKYTIEGNARDNRRLRAVCRIAATSGKLIVITVYDAS